MEDQKKVFGNNLKYWLYVKDIQQTELADALGVSRSTVSMWCAGVTIPRMPKAQMVAEFLKIPVSELVENRNNGPVRKVMSYENMMGMDAGNNFSYAAEESASYRTRAGEPKEKPTIQQRLKKQQINQINRYVKQLNIEGLMKLEEYLFDLAMNEEYTKPDEDDGEDWTLVDQKKLPIKTSTKADDHEDSTSMKPVPNAADA